MERTGHISTETFTVTIGHLHRRNDIPYTEKNFEFISLKHSSESIDTPNQKSQKSKHCL